MKRMWGTKARGDMPFKRKTTGFSGKSIKEPRIVSLLVSLIRTMRRYSPFRRRLGRKSRLEPPVEKAHLPFAPPLGSLVPAEEEPPLSLRGGSLHEDLTLPASVAGPGKGVGEPLSAKVELPPKGSGGARKPLVRLDQERQNKGYSPEEEALPSLFHCILPRNHKRFPLPEQTLFDTLQRKTLSLHLLESVFK